MIQSSKKITFIFKGGLTFLIDFILKDSFAVGLGFWATKNGQTHPIRPLSETFRVREGRISILLVIWFIDITQDFGFDLK